MNIIPKPFEVPLQVGDLDCLVTVKVTGYALGSPGRFNPLTGVGNPPEPAEIEFAVESIRIDGEWPPEPITGHIGIILETSDYLFHACLDAIEEANQPPED